MYMGICCSYDVECEHCKCPKKYYRNHEHASRKSCRRFSERQMKMDYHKWSIKPRFIIIEWIKHLKNKQQNNMVQGYVLEEEVRLPEWSKGSR